MSKCDNYKTDQQGWKSVNPVIIEQHHRHWLYQNIYRSALSSLSLVTCSAMNFFIINTTTEKQYQLYLNITNILVAFLQICHIGVFDIKKP